MRKTHRNIYHPFYWPAWCLIGVFWLLTQLLPYRALLGLGKLLGLLMLKFDKRQRQTTTVNLNLCFPEKTEKEKDNLLRESYISLGIAIFEGCLAWWASDRKLRDLAHFHGMNNIQSAQKEGKGILLFGIHFTTLELSGRLYTLNGLDFTIVYRSHKNPLMNHLISTARKRHYPNAIERNNVRGILKALKKGKMVWYTPDIDAGYYDHVFAPFFGIPAASLTASSRLPAITGANTLLCTYFRRDDATGYDIYFSPKIENFPTDNLEHDITLVNKLTEDAIRKKPEQYLWQYKRFKTRPGDEPRYYK